MNYSVDGWNNFCRVFELPVTLPTAYCLGVLGSTQVPFKMIDWFNPVRGLAQYAISKEQYEQAYGEVETIKISLEELQTNLVTFIQSKQYTKPGRKYLVLCDFGAVFCVEKD